MGTVNWDYWLEELFLTVPMAERELLNHQTRAAAIEFCNLSEAWRLKPLPITIVNGQDTYAIDVQISGTEISKVVEHTFKTHDIGFKLVEANRLKLDKVPDATLVDELQLNCAIRPTRIAEGMNEEVGKRYFDAILSGAKARLYMMPQKPWSDGNAAVYQRSLMTEQADRARTDANMGNGRINRRTKLHLINGR